jgi:hypothetical protein
MLEYTTLEGRVHLFEVTVKLLKLSEECVNLNSMLFRGVWCAAMRFEIFGSDLGLNGTTPAATEFGARFCEISPDCLTARVVADLVAN